MVTTAAIIRMIRSSVMTSLFRNPTDGERQTPQISRLSTTFSVMTVPDRGRIRGNKSKLPENATRVLYDGDSRVKLRDKIYCMEDKRLVVLRLGSLRDICSFTTAPVMPDASNAESFTWRTSKDNIGDPGEIINSYAEDVGSQVGFKPRVDVRRPDLMPSISEWFGPSLETTEQIGHLHGG